MKCQLIATTIILLFICVAIAPSINFTVVKASNENDLVEVTSQACGIQGFGNTTVKLTREQYQNLEEYLVEFRARLNQTTTREEAVPIFKEAVVELDKYGLLPEGMSVEKAQRLVTRNSFNSERNNFRKEATLKDRGVLDNNSNFACLVCGHSTQTVSVPLFPLIAEKLYVFLLVFGPVIGSLLEKINATFLIRVFERFYLSVFYFFQWYVYQGIPFAFNRPLFLFTTLAIGLASNPNPGSGSIFTVGLNGVKKFSNQPLYGNLPNILFGAITYYHENFFYPAIFGFTGFHLFNIKTGYSFYLGSALWVKIGSEPPR